MNDWTYDQFPLRLRESVPAFSDAFDEHVRDYDEILPHVLMGEFARFVLKEARETGLSGASLKPAVDVLEKGMSSLDPRVPELIAVSFLEVLDPTEDGFPLVRNLFGPLLEEQFRACGASS